MKNLYGFINAREKVMRGVFLFSAIFSILALVTITVFLFVSGVPFIAKTGFAKFIFGSDWAPLADNPSFGILPMIVASLYVTALSVIFGIGIGLIVMVIRTWGAYPEGMSFAILIMNACVPLLNKIRPKRFGEKKKA